MNTFKYLTLIIYTLILNGCATGTVVNYASDEVMSTGVSKTHQAYIDKEYIFICYDGASRPISGTRSLGGKDIIIRNNEVIVFEIKNMKHNNKSYKYIESDEIVEENCATYTMNNANLKKLPLYNIRTELTCGSSVECDNAPVIWKLQNTDVNGVISDAKFSHHNKPVLNDAILKLDNTNLKIRNVLVQTHHFRRYSAKREFKPEIKELYYIDTNGTPYKLKFNWHTYKRGFYPLYILTPVTVVLDIVTLPIQLIIAKQSFDSSF